MERRYRLCCPGASCLGEVGTHVGNDILEQLVCVFVVEITWEVPSLAAMSVDEAAPGQLMSKVWRVAS